MLFTSRKRAYKIIIKPKRFALSRDGEKVLLPGTKVIFQNGVFETEDKDLIKELKDTKYFGVDYFISDAGDENTPTEEGQNLEIKTKQASEDALRACPYCSFNAQNKIGLYAHIKSKHPGKAQV